MGQSQYAYDLSNFSLTCLQYAENNRICCHGHGLMKASEEANCIHQSTNSETAIQWCFLKQSYIKIAPQGKGSCKLFFCKHSETF